MKTTHLNGVILLGCAIVIVHMWATGTDMVLLTDKMRPLILATGMVCLVAGAWLCVTGGGEKVKWRDHTHLALIVAPLAVLGCVNMTAPMSHTPDVSTRAPAWDDVDTSTLPAQWVNQHASPHADESETSSRPEPLDYETETPDFTPGDTVDPYTLAVWSLSDQLTQFVGEEVTIVGYTSSDPDRPGGPWMVTRRKMWCCAADTVPFGVSVLGAQSVEWNQWVKVRGVIVPPAKNRDVAVRVVSVEPVDAPEEAYIP